MYLSRHQSAAGPRWALEGRYLPAEFTLEQLLEIPGTDVRSFLEDLGSEELAEEGPLLPPIEPAHEVWASGVTYLQSREARELESTDADAYQKIYDAVRPELFFKAIGWRVARHRRPCRRCRLPSIRTFELPGSSRTSPRSPTLPARARRAAGEDLRPPRRGAGFREK